MLVSFCNDLGKDQLKSYGCDESASTMAIYKDDSGKCQVLSGADPSKDADFDRKTDTDGLTIKYYGGDSNFQLTLDATCVKNGGDFGNATLNSADPKNIVASFTSNSACNFGKLNSLWQWFNNNKWAMFALFLVVGLVTCFMGRTLFRPVIFIVGVIMATSLIMLISYSTFLSDNDKTWVGWVVLAVAVLLGLLLGFLFIKFIKLGAFALAAWGGFSFALLIYNAFLYKMDSDAGFWCFTIGTAVVFGVLALCFFDHILIHATALLGSFMAVYGIGLVAGRYQNPFTIVQMIKEGTITSIDPVFYAYLAGNLILYVLGFLFQYRQKNGNPDHDPYERLRKQRKYY